MAPTVACEARTVAERIMLPTMLPPRSKSTTSPLSHGAATVAVVGDTASLKSSRPRRLDPRVR